MDGETLSFGVSGMLWRENLVMYDRQTDSWWSQADGKAIRGQRQGVQLTQLPSDLMSWSEWRALHPATLVLSTGARASGDRYADYHSAGNIGVTGRTRSGGALDAKAKVVGFRLGGRAFAVDLEKLARTKVLAVDAGGTAALVALSSDGTTARVHLAGAHAFSASPTNDTRRLARDAATQSFWDGFDGTAIMGRLVGTRLERVPAHVSYWFSWHSFFPETTVLGDAK